jgi:hypothetical protein
MREDPAKLRHKRDEMRFEISLQVRQIPPVKLHIKILALEEDEKNNKQTKNSNRFPGWEPTRHQVGADVFVRPASAASVPG